MPRFGAQGEFQGYIGSYTDIDDRRKTEEKLRQAAKLESLGVLAGGIAHDFNNLLVAILGNASLLEDYIPVSAPARELLRQRHQGQRARRPAHPADAGLFRPGPLRGGAARPFRPGQTDHRADSGFLARNVEVRLNLGDGLPPVEADASQLQQLIMNLVINAAEAIEDGPGVVEVVTGETEVNADEMAPWVLADNVKPGRYVVPEVRDTGTRHGRSDPGEDLRPVLHHQVHRTRPGTGGRPWESCAVTAAASN